MGTPVLVNGRCDVLVGQCRRSQGGLWYTNEAEFIAALGHLCSRPDLRRRLARNGARYLEENYSWGAIESKYRRIAAAALPHLAEQV
jgi:glycosyltransferase involved in cell wall biosynthesis